MKPSAVISHIVLSLTLVTSIITGFYCINEYGLAPMGVLLTAGGAFVLGTQIMYIITGE
jgi:hypothetical protein